ncbi:MAG: isoprenyl transferase [Paludibacteraceae bacterium]|nr:isoprenyl transferase [Paludibacteraceae bacterium]
MSLKQYIDPNRIPEHVAIIMDGNGRWAQAHGEQRVFGHHNGVHAVHCTTQVAAELGVKYLTLYAFSTENWNRPQAEVDALMNLFVDTIERETPTLCENNIRLTAIGDLARLPERTREKFEECIRRTAQNTGMTLVLALSYSARWEITQAVRNIAAQVAEGTANLNQIDEGYVSRNLTTKDIPDPDLLIRTSGELRISNFLLWQIAYAELYFTDQYWPDFDEESFYKAIIDYQHRERRFGKTSEQLAK